MLRERQVKGEELERVRSELPDSTGNLRQLTDEEAEQFETGLAPEAEVRAERIERALERAAAPPPAPPEPVQEFDEDEI
jgi:hypothetical protein